MTDTRDRIETHVSTHPGVHFNELITTLDLAPGQVQYHLRRLLTGDVLVREELYGRTHYFTPEYDNWERGMVALVRRETARDILAYLIEHGSPRPNPVADELGIARSTLEWHLNHLVEQEVVEKHRDARNRVTLVLARPLATGRLLKEITPSLPERLVDRFTRLVDQLLEDA